MRGVQHAATRRPQGILHWPAHIQAVDRRHARPELKRAGSTERVGVLALRACAYFKYYSKTARFLQNLAKKLEKKTRSRPHTDQYTSGSLRSGTAVSARVRTTLLCHILRKVIECYSDVQATRSARWATCMARHRLATSTAHTHDARASKSPTLRCWCGMCESIDGPRLEA